MKRVIVIGIALFLVCIFKVDATSAAEKSLVYRTYVGAGGEAIAEISMRFEALPDGKASISRTKQAGDITTEDVLALDQDYSLESWKRTCAAEETDLTSIREGDAIVVRGKLKGKMIDKQIELDGKSLYPYPKYSLAKFALSDMKKMKFWTLRRDKMSRLPMQAIKKGTETITVNGKEEEAIKVYYSITGKLREKQFNHNYYYRKSDGLFLKKEESKGKIEELVKEE